MKIYLFVVFFLFGIVSTDDSLKIFGSPIFFLLFALPAFLSFLSPRNSRYTLFLILIWAVICLTHISNLPNVNFDWLNSSIRIRFFLQLIRLFILLVSINFFISSYSKFKSPISRSLVFSSIFIYLSVIFQVILHFSGIKVGETYLNEFGQLRFGSFLGEPQILNFYALPGLSYSLMSFFLKKSDMLSKAHLLIYLIALPFCYSTAILSSLILILLLIVVKSKNARYLLIILFAIAFVFSTKKIDQAFTINVRSITIVAGVELLKTNTLIGKGIGLSPFYLYETEIFSSFPEFNFSNDFRQNIMNSYVEILVELGLVGIIMILILIKKIRPIYLNIYHYQSIRLVSFVYLLAALSVGSVFYSSAMLFIVLSFRSKLIDENV